MGALASGVYLSWNGDNNLSNVETDVREYVNGVNDYITKTEKAINSLKSQVETLKETKADMEQQLAEQNSNNEKLQAAVDELEQEITIKVSRIDELQSSLDETTSLLLNANTEIERLTEENERLTLESKNAADEVEHLNNQLTIANNSAQTHEQNINGILEGAKVKDYSIFDDIDENQAIGTNLINFNKVEFERNNMKYEIKSNNSISVSSTSTTQPGSFTTTFKVEKGKKYRLTGDSFNVYADIKVLTNESGSGFSFSSTDVGESSIDKTFTAERSFVRLVVKSTYGGATGSNHRGSVTLSNLSLVEIEE